MTFLCCSWRRRRLADGTWWRKCEPDPVTLHDAGVMIPLQLWEQRSRWISGALLFPKLTYWLMVPCFPQGRLSMQMRMFLPRLGVDIQSRSLIFLLGAQSCGLKPLIAALDRAGGCWAEICGIWNPLHAICWLWWEHLCGHLKTLLFNLQLKCTCTELNSTLPSIFNCRCVSHGIQLHPMECADTRWMNEWTYGWADGRLVGCSSCSSALWWHKLRLSGDAGCIHLLTSLIRFLSDAFPGPAESDKQRHIPLLPPTPPPLPTFLWLAWKRGRMR